MRLNANQINALASLEDMFHFDISEDRLDRRTANVKAWNFDYSVLRIVDIDQNGTVFELEAVS